MASSTTVDRVTPVGSAAKFTLISVLVECTLYGVFMLLCCISLFIVLRNRAWFCQASSRQMRIYAVGVLMFILATVHVGVDIHRVLDAFLGPDPVAALIPIDNVAFLVKQATFDLQIMFGDAFWLYRLHVVWMGDKRVVIPLFIILLIDVGLAFYILHLFRATPGTFEDAIFLTRIYYVGVAVVTLTLVVNLSCTILIATRLYLIHRRVKRRMEVLGESRSTVLSTFALLVAESGALYSALLLILLVAFVTNSYVCSILNDAVVQAVGIVFYIMIFQAKYGKLMSSTTDNTLHNRPSTSHRNQPRICDIPLRRMSNMSQNECDISSAGALEPKCPPKAVHVTRWDTARSEV